MTNLEFITANRALKIPRLELYDFIVQRVLNDKIVIIEEIFSPAEKMQLIARSLEKSSTKDYYGFKMIQIKIKSENNRLLRGKKDIQFNLFAPGSSVIEQNEDGHYSVKMDGGNVVTAAL